MGVAGWVGEGGGGNGTLAFKLDESCVSVAFVSEDVYLSIR